MFKCILSAIFCLSLGFAYAKDSNFPKKVKSDSPLDDYYSVAKVELEYLGTELAHEQRDEGELGPILKSIDELIATGEKIYQIVKKGSPVVQSKMVSPIDVFPKLEGRSH